MLSRMLGVAALTASALAAESWSYSRCSDVGPNNWPSTCAVASQTEGSPINLCGASALPTPISMTANGYGVAQTLNVLNTGHTVQVNVPAAAAPTLQVGNLSTIVGRQGGASDTWVLAQVHPHWGREGHDDEGSEHYKEAARYPFEAHRVHYNQKYNNLSYAVSTGSKDALLVVGVLFSLGGTTSDFISKFADSVANATGTAQAMSSTVTLSDIFNGTGAFYSYGGSLTTPNCNQQVTWIVMKGVQTITSAALAKFKAAKKYENGVKLDELISETGNFRPLQALGNRTIYQSDAPSVSCTAATQPTFTCPSPSPLPPKNGAASVSPLAAVNLLLALIFVAMYL